MPGTSARLLQLLALLQARRWWGGPELAERLGVTGRTLRRDVDRLRELGYEVEATSGPGGGYRFGPGSELPPLLLSEDEAVTLTVALRAAVELADGGDHVPAVLAKLDQILPDRLRARVAAVHSQTVSVGGPRSVIDPTLLTRLAAACRDGDAVRITYRPADGPPAERTVHPLRLAHTGSRRWYLVAWDPSRDAWRTLRVDRIEALLAVGPRVTRPPPPEDLELWVAQAIARAPYPCQGTFEVEGTLTELSARIPQWIGALRESGPGRCRLEVGGPDWVSVVSYATICDAPLRIVGPPELALVAARVGARLTAAAEPGPL
jgi:predicted DNA-binding transcriptional regulator YafY